MKPKPHFLVRLHDKAGTIARVETYSRSQNLLEHVMAAAKRLWGRRRFMLAAAEASKD